MSSEGINVIEFISWQILVTDTRNFAWQ